MSDGVSQYSIIKQSALTNADTYKQICKISLPMSNAARKQQGLDCEDLRTKYENEHLP